MIDSMNSIIASIYKQGCKSGFLMGGGGGGGGWGDNWLNLTKICNLTSFGGMIFCKHKSILESTQDVKFSIPTMCTKLIRRIFPNKCFSTKNRLIRQENVPYLGQLSDLAFSRHKKIFGYKKL